MKKKLLIIGLCLIAVGCGKEKTETKLNINCNGEKQTIVLKEDERFKCELLGTDYEFTIEKLDSDKVTIKSSAFGLTQVKSDGTISLVDNNTEFTVEKNKELKLSTQTTDYSENITISWK